MGFWTRGFYWKKGGFEVRKMPVNLILRRLVVVLIVTLVLAVGFIYLFKNSFIFYPHKGLKLSPASTGWAFEDIWLAGSDGRINGWYLPVEGAPTVLLFHGNGGNVEDMIPRIITYHRLGYGLLTIDYQGYGLSEGHPSEEALYQNAEAAWQFLTRDKGLDPETIIIHGFSLGGGVATWLSRQHREHHNVLILDSTFTNIKDVAVRHLPLLTPILSLIVGGDFDNLARLKEISPRYLVIFHSVEDNVVPYELGRRLFESYDGGPSDFVELKGRHMEYLINYEAYADVFSRIKAEYFPSTESADNLTDEKTEGLSAE